MIIDLDPFTYSAAYARRLELAITRGHDGDDQYLPTRKMTVIEEGMRKTVAIGPVEPGGPDEILWKYGFEVS